MITITIQRQNKNNICTTGVFKAVSSNPKIKGLVNGYTLEPPDLNIKGEAKCILPDTYKAKLYESPRFKTTVILLEDKHDREYIEIHPGNYPKDTTGCILVGSSQGKDVVWRSWEKMKELIDFVKADIGISGENGGKEDEKKDNDYGIIEVIIKDVV